MGLGRKSNEIEYMVLPHADINRSGSVAKLREITDAKIAVHLEDAPAFAGGGRLKFAGDVFSIDSRGNLKLSSKKRMPDQEQPQESISEIAQL